MNEELNNQAVDTSVPATEPTEAQVNQVQQKPERTYTRSKIVEMMKKRVARSHNAFFNRYGVKDLQGLDELFDKTQQYDQMNNEYASIKMRNDDLMRENSFLRNNINPDKYNDIVAYFKGMGLEFSEENLLTQIGTHPEWLKPSTIPAPTTTFKSLGTEQHGKSIETNEEKMRRVFGN